MFTKLEMHNYGEEQSEYWSGTMYIEVDNDNAQEHVCIDYISILTVPRHVMMNQCCLLLLAAGVYVVLYIHKVKVYVVLLRAYQKENIGMISQELLGLVGGVTDRLGYEET